MPCPNCGKHIKPRADVETGTAWVRQWIRGIPQDRRTHFELEDSAALHRTHHGPNALRVGELI